MVDNAGLGRATQSSEPFETVMMRFESRSGNCEIDCSRLQPNTRMGKLDLGPIKVLDLDGCDANLDDGLGK